MPLTRQGPWLRAAVLGAAAIVGAQTAAACGSRSALEIPPEVPPGPECVVDTDCPGHDDLCDPRFCEPSDDAGVARSEDAAATQIAGVCRSRGQVECDDKDPCTNETCDSATGECVYSLATLDADGDGFRGPRPGTLPGAADACGDDCDDTSAAAHPGGSETCDGFDNDCNGVVDDNATYTPLNIESRISGDIAPAGPGGLAFSGSTYAAVYSGTTQGFDMYLSMLDEAGEKLPPGEQLVTLKNADGAGGPIVWVGDRYGLAWQDRRDADYEVYFTLLKETGEKAIADQRLSFASGFSVNVALTWTGTEFVAVWQDDRDGFFNLFAQRVSVDGAPIASNVALTDDLQGLGNEAPSVAAGGQGIGVAWTIGDAYTHVIQFQSFDLDLAPLSPVVQLTDGSTESVYPTIVWNQDRYVVAWFDKSASPKAIYGSVIAEDGTVMADKIRISEPGPFRSRYPFLRPLGDRLLAVYSDDRDQNEGYELYSRMVSDLLAPVGPELRLTNAPRDSIYPIAAFGPEGNVGILFRDDREDGAHHVYFTRLGCVTAPR